MENRRRSKREKELSSASVTSKALGFRATFREGNQLFRRPLNSIPFGPGFYTIPSLNNELEYNRRDGIISVFEDVNWQSLVKKDLAGPRLAVTWNRYATAPLDSERLCHGPGLHTKDDIRMPPLHTRLIDNNIFFVLHSEIPASEQRTAHSADFKDGAVPKVERSNLGSIIFSNGLPFMVVVRGTILRGDDDRVLYKLWNGLNEMYGNEIWVGLVIADAKALRAASVVLQYHTQKPPVFHYIGRPNFVHRYALWQKTLKLSE